MVQILNMVLLSHFTQIFHLSFRIFSVCMEIEQLAIVGTEMGCWSGLMVDKFLKIVLKLLFTNARITVVPMQLKASKVRWFLIFLWNCCKRDTCKTDCKFRYCEISWIYGYPNRNGWNEFGCLFSNNITSSVNKWIADWIYVEDLETS